MTPEQYGQVYGALPHAAQSPEELAEFKGIFGDMWGHLESSKGVVGGMSLGSGSEKEMTGAGQLGSIEPRALEMLKAGHLGDWGEVMHSELLQRRAWTSPEAMTTHNALLSSVESAAAPVISPEGAKNFSISQRDEAGIQDQLRRSAG